MTDSPSGQPEIEFWFDFGSNYSYLSVMRIEAAAQGAGVRIAWKPFLLGPIFKAMGWETSPLLQHKAKADYMWQDMIRQCRKYDLPWTKPTTFPRVGVLPLRVALVGVEQPWIGAFCREIMRLNFAHDRDINTPEAVGEVLAALGLPSADILDAAVAEPNKLRLRTQTEEAAGRGIFGAPTFFVRGEMFWGNDRLDDALAFAFGNQALVRHNLPG